MSAVQQGESPGIIVRIAQKQSVTPCLVAKLILQRYLEEHGECDDEDTNAGNKITMYLRDTTLIPNMDLAYEVFLVGIYVYIYFLFTKVADYLIL